MKAFQYIPYTLPTQTYSAGTRTTQTLRDLPKVFLGKLAHVEKFLFSCVLTPTFTTLPVTVGNNNLMTAVDFWDGTFMRFQGGFNHMRAKERLQAGRNRLADASTATTSTNSRFFKRVLHAGPPQLEGAPSDFVIPTGMLENGELRFTHGNLTDISADTTAATGSVRVTACLVLFDEIRIPPAYQFINQVASAGDTNLAGRALYECIGAVSGSTFAAFTNGQIGNVRIDFGQGDIVPTVSCRDLAAAFAADFNSGDIGVPQGDPEGTADTNNVQVNRGTPTALTTPANDLAPFWWSPTHCRINKLNLAESVCRVRWDGSLTPITLLLGRILSQPATVVAANVGKALGRLNVKAKSYKIKTLSKDEYTGSYGEFMPFKVSV